MTFAQIAIPSTIDCLFTYHIPKGLEGKIEAGHRVIVPFRKQKRIGFCVGLTAQLSVGLKEESLKEIEAVKEEKPIVSKPLLQLIEWLADYYMAPIGEVFKSALPSPLSQLKAPSKANPKLAEEEHLVFSQPDPLQLNSDQTKAYQFIFKETQNPNKKPILLHGITGSGKTEIYLQLVSQLLKEGKQAILLVPEISLTPQLIGRVQSRLRERIAIYHSGLSDSWRHRYWEEMRSGQIRVVVGTRSALFAPFQNLGIIIVDEEQDSSYKQGEGSFHYHARDAAIVRGKIENGLVLLGSATPSLESFHNAKKGKYHYMHLSERATGANLPKVELIDLRKIKLKEGSQVVSGPLFDAIAENLYRGEQSLLFLNRRGFANFILCEDCGEPIQCPNCAISLTYHKQRKGLVCHYCDLTMTTPEQCTHCKSGALKAIGQGTEKLEEELKTFFPEANIARLDRDTALKRDHRHQVLSQMQKGKVDILLGTQIIAKGHDFSNVTLVGVLLADTTLNLPDFRAAEKTFQLLTQVAGRAGRDQKPGRVLIQTFHPEHFSLLCAKEHNFESFSEEELRTRQTLHYPPFSRLAQIRLQSAHEKRVEKTAQDLKEFLKKSGGTLLPNQLQILGPAKSPVAKVRGKYRWQVLIKASDIQTLKNSLKRAKTFSQKHLPSTVQIQIDIDCLNLM